MRFRTSNLYVSAIPPFVIGLVVGILAAIMGIGGGFIMVPAMIYLIGMPTQVVVGTSVFQFLFVTGITAVLHAVQSGTVDVMLALILLVGGVIGAQIGVGLAARLRAEQLRRCLALLVLGVCLKLFGDLVIRPAELFSLAGAPERCSALALAPLACRRPLCAGRAAAGDGRHRRLDRQHRADRELHRLGDLRLRRGPARRTAADRGGAARHRHHRQGPAADGHRPAQGAPLRDLGEYRVGTVRQAPSFYAIATTRPLDEILSETERLRYGIGMDQAVRRVGGRQIADSTPFTDALIRLREGTGSYAQLDDAVTVAEETLFQTRIEMPANLVEGDYVAEFFLVRDHQVISSAATIIRVEKTGIERWLYNLSRNQPLVYGLMSVGLALLAGWLANAAFRFGRGWPWGGDYWSDGTGSLGTAGAASLLLDARARAPRWGVGDPEGLDRTGEGVARNPVKAILGPGAATRQSASRAAGRLRLRPDCAAAEVGRETARRATASPGPCGSSPPRRGGIPRRCSPPRRSPAPRGRANRSG